MLFAMFAHTMNLRQFAIMNITHDCEFHVGVNGLARANRLVSPGALTATSASAGYAAGVPGPVMRDTQRDTVSPCGRTSAAHTVGAAMILTLSRRILVYGVNSEIRRHISEAPAPRGQHTATESMCADVAKGIPR